MDDSGNNFHKKQGTRVFKKSSPNGKITTYLCKRDFIDSLADVDPIEGVVLVDPEYVKGRKVFTHVLSAFRYGREDLDVLGLTFRKDLYLASAQVYPPIYATETDKSGKILLNPASTAVCGGSKSPQNSHDAEFSKVTEDSLHHGTLPLTRLQERLIKKLGNNAFPFYFKLPADAPASVTLQPGPNENGKPCGVDYELRTYVAETSDEKLQKRNAVRLAIRKLTYAPEEPAPQPSAVVLKEFIMSPGTLRLEVSLNKEKYYHGESIEINVLVDNNSNKTVKKIKLSVVQITDIALFSRAIYKCTVDEAEYDESFPILPSQTGWCKVYKLRPLLANNRHKRGLALDGKLKHEDTNLASSTIICNPNHKENLGMTVQYRVKVRLVLGFVSSDVSVELPFTLTHPKPDPEVDVTSSKLVVVDDDIRNPLSSSVPNDTIKYQSQLRSIQQGSSDQNVNISDDLIKLDDGINEKNANYTPMA
ncbi:Beta-arrestin-1 [Schistosoma japonicum]|uniref:Beta-arrestin-1 n=1 Tax=Schistosoma japonicum TaxID=6182 RepID=A0A4Z2D299_SCHJA|nr:Beta-arrestin-1 [Schistosoma japonicum]